MKQVLTIAGSDSGAGAGVQADLKTFAVFGVYGTSTITAVTAQNTLGVIDYSIVPIDIIKKQIEAVLTDFNISAVKIGMLPNIEIIELVSNLLKNSNFHIVLDTVMSSKGGKNLTNEDTSSALKKYLFPLSTIITPNIPETEILTGNNIKNTDDIKKSAIKLADTGTKNVLIKGGHFKGKKSIDVLYDGEKFYYFENDRLESKNTHGTGCTLSSAIAANLALGLNVHDAVKTANSYVYKLIKNSNNFNLGHGHGPMNHFI